MFYLKCKLLIENRIEGLPVDLGLKLLLLVRQQVDLYIWVRSSAHVHSRQLCRLNDSHNELGKKTKVKKEVLVHTNHILSANILTGRYAP